MMVATTVPSFSDRMFAEFQRTVLTPPPRHWMGISHRLPPLPLQGIGHLSQGLLPPLLGEEDLGIFADHLLGGVPVSRSKARLMRMNFMFGPQTAMGALA